MSIWCSNTVFWIWTGMSIKHLPGFVCWEFLNTFLHISSLHMRMWGMNLCKWHLKSALLSNKHCMKRKKVDTPPVNPMGKCRHLLLVVYSACNNWNQQNYFTVNGEKMSTRGMCFHLPKPKSVKWFKWIMFLKRFDSPLSWRSPAWLSQI